MAIDEPGDRLLQGLPERRFRPELHGLRGLAILGVVLFHLFGDGRISGGIDLFLAVSGFLFTGMLLREAAERGGRIDAGRYFGRLARRILAPAALVVAATTALGLLALPFTRHAQLWAEARASLLYYENLELISSQLAYGAAGPETSPFQHFWSLSVQGQFYLVWPLVALLAVGIARRLRRSAAAVMAVLTGLILAGSFAYALYLGSVHQPEAYLATGTRLWQLAFGGLLALLGARLTLPRPVRGAAGWLGVLLVVSCGLVLDGAQLFPGPWSLWPLAGLALVLAAGGPEGGAADAPGTATRLLSGRVFSWVGDHSYALYLWHWPLLIFALELLDRESVGLGLAAVILSASFLLAWLTHRLVEVPLTRLPRGASRQRLRRLNRTSIAAGLLVLLAGGGAATAAIGSRPDPSAVAEASPVHPGAMVTAGAAAAPADVDPVPALDVLPSVRPDYYAWGCKQSAQQTPGTEEVLVCDDPNPPEEPRARVVVAGGSHAGHWVSAVRQVADRQDWEVLVVDRSSCPFGRLEGEDDPKCQEWQDNFVEWLRTADADLVITPGTRMDTKREFIMDEAPERWRQISETGTDVLLLRGTPRRFGHVSDCLAEGRASAECGPSTAQIAEQNPLELADLPEGVHAVDLLENVCPALREGGERCDAVVGNVVVWHDGHHLTNDFAASASPILEEKMREAVPALFR